MATLIDLTLSGDLTSTHPIYPGYNNGGVGSQSSYYLYGNTSSSGVRTNGNFLVDGNIYWGNYGVWLSDWVNQNLRTDASPTFTNVYSNDWFRNYNNTGLYNQTYGTHFYSSSTTQWDFATPSNIYIALRTGHQGAVRGYLHANTDNNSGLLSSDGSWSVRVNNSEVELYHVTYADDMRANIYYDRGNTNYYLDPASTSVLNSIITRGTVNLADGSYYGTLVFGQTSTWHTGISQRDAGDAEMRIWAKNAAGSIYLATGHDGTSSSTALPTDGMAIKSNNVGIGNFGAHNNDPAAKLHIKNSISGNDALAIDGVNGRLFTVTDDLSDSLFSVNTVAGLPVIEAFADNTVKIGPFTAPVEITSAGELKVNGGTNLGTAITGATVSNDTITFTRADGNTFAVTTSDADTNTVTSIGISGDLSTGNITLAGSGATTITKSGGTITISSTDTDTNTWRPIGTGATDAAAGNHNHNGTYLGVSDKAADSNLLDGLDLHTGRNNEANKVVRTDGNGYIQAGWINTTSGDNGTTAIGRIYASQDGYIRYYTPSNFISVLGLITTGNIGSQSVSYASSAGSADSIDGWGFRNTGSNDGINADSINSNGITYYTGGVSNFSGNASDGALYSQRYSDSWQHQIAGDYRSGMIAVRGKNNGTWTAWKTVIDSSTIGSQSVSYATSAGTANTANSATTASTATTATSASTVGWGGVSGKPNSISGYGITDGVTTANNSSLNSDTRNTRGVTRLYRRDDNSDHSIQTHWTGSHWLIRGYNGDSFHAEARVAYADAAGSANTASSASTASQVTVNYNNDSNSTYQMLWGSGNSVYGTGGIYCNPNSDIIYAAAFYDANDTGYYLNPNGYSNLYTARAYEWQLHAGAGYGVRFWNGSSSYSIQMSEAGNGTWGGRVAGETTSDYNMYFTMTGGTNRGFVFRNGLSSGSVVAGIDAGGNFRATGDAIVYASSDARLKKNVKPIENALDKVMQINGVEFDWDEAAQDVHKGHDVGVIAQEIEAVLPEIVQTRDNGYKAVKYEKLVALLIESVKELQAEIEDLKAQIK